MNERIRIGSKGPRVVEVQKRLNAAGFTDKDGNALDTDGIYGAKTDFAARAYCRAHDIHKPAGRVTREFLRHIGEGSEPVHQPQSAFNIRGIDTSGHQRTVDAAAVAESGERFHIVKVTESTSYIHKKFAVRVQESVDARLLVGAYHFLRSDKSDANKEAAHFLKHYTSSADLCTLPPMADLEKGDKQDHAHNVRHAIEFARAVQAELGCGKLLLYTTRPSWGAYMHKAGAALLAELAECYDLVWADYVREGKAISGDIALTEGFDHSDLRKSQKAGLPWDHPVIWQWTGKGTVPGVYGKCDRCLMRGDYFERFTER